MSRSDGRGNSRRNCFARATRLGLGLRVGLAAGVTAGARRGVRWEGIRGWRWGLFHRDPKRIVGVLRVTLLNRLNNSTEWAELPFGRQTLHHDWLLPYRGLQASLFVLSLGIELTHFLHPKLPTVIRIGEQDSGRAVPSPSDDRVCWQTAVLDDEAGGQFFD